MKPLHDLVKDVQDSWINLLIHGIPQLGGKKAALKLLKHLIEIQSASIKQMKFIKEETFLGTVNDPFEIPK